VTYNNPQVTLARKTKIVFSNFILVQSEISVRVAVRTDNF